MALRIAFGLLIATSATAKSHLRVSGQADKKCTGGATLPGNGPFCFHAKIGMLGVTETLDLKVMRSSSEGSTETGAMDLIGSGVSPFSCKDVKISKNGQQVTADEAALKKCLPRGVTVHEVMYCSDTNEVEVTISDSNIPVVGKKITEKAEAIKCQSDTPALEVANVLNITRPTMDDIAVLTGKNADITITSCGGDATNVKFSYSPNPAPVGGRVTISGSAVVAGSADSAPVYKLNAKYGAVTLIKDHQDTICKATTVNLPLGIGHVDVSGLAAGCPAKPGVLSTGVNMPVKNLPGTVSAKFEIMSSSGSTHICLNVEVKV